MTDGANIAQVATAGGTLVLAIATFSSIKSANRSARIAERALQAQQRPVLIPSREDDPDELIRFIDDVIFTIPGHGGIAKLKDEQIYMAMALRNGGAGLAVILGWRVETDSERRTQRPENLDDFRRQTRDLYIPAGSSGFWQGAIRDQDDASHRALSTSGVTGERILVDLLYGDFEGGQRTIARFGVPFKRDGDEAPEHGKRADVLRYWNVDGNDPR